MEFDFSRRLTNLYKKISTEMIDILLITKTENIKYFSGFNGDSSILIVGKSFKELITDGRYSEQARQEIKNFQVVEQKNGLLKKVSEEIKQASPKIIGVEKKYISLEAFDYLKKNINAVFKFIELDQLRMIKDKAEIFCIRSACRIADKAFENVLKFIKPDITEIEIAAELEYLMRKFGSEKIAFDTIVASGKRGSLSHGVPTTKKISSGEFITIDFGATFNGYRSDITRTICVGRASEKQKSIYDAVLKSQLCGLRNIKTGEYAKEIDTKVRRSLDKFQLEKYFIHGLGHGVGLEIHEAPRLSKSGQNEKLLANMIVTVEPGVYISGFGGVRIEDTVLVTSNGAKILTTSSKKLIEI